ASAANINWTGLDDPLLSRRTVRTNLPEQCVRARHHGQVRAEAAKISGSVWTGTTQTRWPPGERNVWASCQRATGSAPSPVRRATSAARVIGLDVEMVTRRVVDSLDEGDQTRDGATQDGVLLLARRGIARDAQPRGPEVHFRADLRGGRVDEDPYESTA